ncbi:Fe(2+) transporter [Entophlyctis luteolus]|nr:Fe(2+) transporter [Entophlyctis luteolus]KAJ3353846.1 Fe(2+) transporter [Entophlyctis luteolus]KAJ3392750.1 Fe(2+) transporter [Entophlyctis sp. JEL0112]
MCEHNNNNSCSRPGEDDYELLPNSPVHVNMMAGALAGITEHALIYPIDAVKTRMQTQPAGLHSGISSTIARVTHSEGAAALWRGVNSVVMGAGPAHALSFAIYEHFKTVFGVDEQGNRVFESAAAGACATIAHDGLMTPFDVIKQRMQLQSGSRFANSLACARQILRSEGLRAFYMSYPTTLTMNIPYHSVHFSAYEHFKKALNPSKQYDPVSHCLAGGIAGGLAAAVTAPLDVVKTLLQTRGVNDDVRVRTNVNGFKDASKFIYQNYGLKGFLRGVGPRVLTHVPATAISWTTYEFLKMAILGSA